VYICVIPHKPETHPQNQERVCVYIYTAIHTRKMHPYKMMVTAVLITIKLWIGGTRILLLNCFVLLKLIYIYIHTKKKTKQLDDK
jgi:hypothetical protein